MSCLLARLWHKVARAFTRATATVLELPSPVPGGTSLAVNTDRPLATPNSPRMDLRYARSPSPDSSASASSRSNVRKSEELICTMSSIVRLRKT